MHAFGSSGSPGRAANTRTPECLNTRILRFSVLALTVILTGAGGAAPKTGPPVSDRFLYYTRLDQLEGVQGPARRIREVGFTGAIVPLVLKRGKHPTQADWREAARAVRRTVGEGELWLVLGSTSFLPDGKRVTLAKWEDEAAWKRLLSSVEQAARAAAEVKAAGIALDSEFYPGDGTVNQIQAWTDSPKVPVRARDYVRTLRRGFPGVVLANDALHYWMEGRPGYRSWWRAAFAEAGPGRGLMLACDTFYRSDPGPAELRQRFRRLWGVETLPGWLLRETDTQDARLARFVRQSGRQCLFFAERSGWLKNHPDEVAALRRVLRREPRRAPR